MAGLGTWDFADVLARGAREVQRTSRATVARIDSEGTPWVRIEGGAGEFPVAACTADVSVGDEVTVTVRDGRASIDGNATSPAAGTVRVMLVEQKADGALESAGRALVAAEGAERDAQRAAVAADAAETDAGRAATAASNAEASASQAAADAGSAASSAQEASSAARTAQQQAQDATTAADEAKAQSQRAEDAADAAVEDARDAKAAATQANAYSNAALDQLGVVQDVAGILTWASEHGSFERTSDTAIVEHKVYFTFDGADYTPVVDPQATELASYYELTVDEAMNDFIMAHLAVTQRGLWVLPSGIGQAADEQHAPGYKMLLASDGCYLYDAQGALVRSDTASGTDFAEGRGFHFGSDDAYILYTPASGSNPAQITIGGANVVLGDSRTLSELLDEVDATFDFKVTDAYSQDSSTATLTAHVYKGGEDVASQYPDSAFAWYRKSEDGLPMVPLGNGRTITVERSTVGFGAAIRCNFTPPNDSALLTGDDDSLTTQDGTPMTARTPSGDYVRVADLAVETTVFDTDKVMLIGSEDEHLVPIATLKETFGDGDYERLSNKPSIEGVTLSGNKDFPDLGIFQTDQQGYSVPDEYTLTTLDINALWANAQPIGA